jgi:uncharacterized RDD family membrane protein YckC
MAALYVRFATGATGRVLAYAAPMAGTCPRCGFAAVEGATCPRCGVDVERYRREIAVAAPSAAVPAPAAPARTTSVAIGRPPAGFWIRAGAALLDGVAIAIAERLLALFAWIAFGHAGSGRALRAAVQTVSVVLIALYFIVCHWQWGQTLGKLAVHVRVVSVDGGPLSLGQAVLRQIGAWISGVLFGVGYLMVAFRSDKRGLHDLIARTRVERLP